MPLYVPRIPLLLAITLSTLAADTASGQTCKPPVAISDVRYLGKVDGNDRVKVSWSLGTGCLGSPGSVFQVAVKVTRRLGRVDEGSIGQAVSGSPMETTVTIPRGPLETDPREYTVSITGSGAANTSASAVAEALISEATSGGGKTFSEPALPSNPCALSAGIVKLAYKGRAAGKDKVEVTWQAKSACVKPIEGRVTVHVISSAGQSSQTTTFPHPASTATSGFDVTASGVVEVPVTSTDSILRLVASLSETGRSSQTVSGGKSGSF